MKKLIIPVRLPAMENEVEVPYNAKPCGVIMSVEKVSNLLMGIDAHNGKEAVREVVNVLLECVAEEDEEGNVKEPAVAKYHFSIGGSLQIIDGGHVDYVGTLASVRDGKLLHVFQVWPHKATSEA